MPETREYHPPEAETNKKPEVSSIINKVREKYGGEAAHIDREQALDHLRVRLNELDDELIPKARQEQNEDVLAELKNEKAELLEHRRILMGSFDEESDRTHGLAA